MTELSTALRDRFGFAAFRGPQQAICEHFLGGGSGLVLMATGGGKSLCYQLPALVGTGLTIVVSPLIALMDDQVAALVARGLPATCIHSQLDRAERQQRLDLARSGAVKLLYVTPERFRVDGFLAAMQAIGVQRLAVDEAHCVSQWGHDFRPDYARLGEVREALGVPPCLALTATATPAVQDDIRSVLRLGSAPCFRTGIDRPNLFLSVRECDGDEAKLARLLALLERTGGPAIVYFALIRDLLRTEGELQRRGLRPLVYHGDLSADERRTQQQRFQRSDDALMLATPAFGMGVDKPDLRAIVHWQLPRTLEAYYQEVGRAGRDDLGACCELLYHGDDLAIQRDFTEWANPSAAFAHEVAVHLYGLGERLQAVDLDTLRATFLHQNRHDGRIDTVLRLLRSSGCTDGEIGTDLRVLRVPELTEVEAWLPADKRQHDLMALLRMVRYATENVCRKQTIHDHFGLPLASDSCGACDVCTDAASWQDAHLPSVRPLSRSPTASTDADRAPLQRGDWIEVSGLGPCCVRRVHRRGRGWTADVERASDLATRSIDLQRRRWRRIEP
ncbi:MAG: RecQ family ATP-dependent DNA helicase [Planctomycetes bacterium]|nr:RecQ family ATP-dependent DNA helicase [Planctomycetota bacterium]